MIIKDLKIGDWFSPTNTNQDIYILAEDGFSYLIQSTNDNAPKIVYFDKNVEIIFISSFKSLQTMIPVCVSLDPFKFDQSSVIKNGEIIRFRNNDEYFIFYNNNLICFYDACYNKAGKIYDNIIIAHVGNAFGQQFNINEVKEIKI